MRHTLMNSAASFVATVVTAAGLTAAVLAGGGSPPAAASTAAAALSTAAAGPAAGSTGQAGGTRLLLINGDQLAVTTAGGRSLIAVRQATRPDAVLSLRLGGQQAEIPAVALPYLNHGMSPSLFTVGALQHEESGGRLPVTLTFAGRRPAVAGVTITRSSAGRALGFLTASSARRFGAALVRQYRADQAHGHFGGGMFAHGLRISLAGTAPAPVPQAPAFRMRSLTVRGTDLDGKPDNGDAVFIFNVDNINRFNGLQEIENVFVHGVAKVSAPVGHYWAFAIFQHLSGTGGSEHDVVLPQFTVGASGRSVVHIAATAASSEVTMAVSRPANTFAAGFTVNRADPHGDVSSAGDTWSGLRGFVSPSSRKPSVGTMRAFTSATLTSPGPVKRPYAYNLDFPAPAGIIPPQHFAVSPAGLATVTERYYQDQQVPAPRAAWTAFGGTVAQFGTGVIGSTAPISMPRVQTQYFSAGPRLLWQNQVWPDQIQFPGGINDNFTVYAPGEKRVENWNNYPLHPAPHVAPGSPAAEVIPTFASAFRRGNTLNLTESPFTDNQPGHINDGLDARGKARASARYAVDQNGTPIAHGNAANGIPAITVSPGPAKIRLTLDAARSGRGIRLSASSRTTWTWRSVRDTGAHVPAGYYCGLLVRGDQVALIRRCAAQPLLTLNYGVRGMSLRGLTRPGPQVIEVTAGHVEPATAAPVKKVTARFSLHDSGTRTPAQVTPAGDGHFRVSFTATAGADVSLRISATDAAGGTIEETIPRAYGVSGPMAASLAHGRALRPACPAVPRGQMRCFALYRPRPQADLALAAGQRAHPVGWSPQALERAYRLPVSRRSHQTVAVSIAFHTPNLPRYLSVYRRHFHLPPCTTASGCLRVVNQEGKVRPLPPSSMGSGWDLEATLDVAMISAACPHCKILVTEAASDSVPDLARTDVTAARMGAQVISNSYGVRENAAAMRFARDYRRPGHTVVASSGDGGFDAANFPASLGAVTAVGGTSLRRARSARGFTERAWNDPAAFAASGSGCSAYVRKPPWQHDSHCPGRTVADISAVASNIPIFNRYYGGWVTVAGTSASAPFVAGAYGLAGNAARLTPRWLYRHRRDFRDVTSGGNVLISTPGQVCGGDYLCQARKGYDAPTGLGSPGGTAGL